ncbi:hypothetical protein COV11_02285 [Candidatus Woesearchaeota archaeon CG10_big_fil_rev_8_21_14_0_10_30_7]|nr:MAG: hypothetical protein COV11_02285 [Candidatus Woesearchaeota archaeon CG10_big_fil_rev_8_21_14_0_10_30_7]
MVKKKKRIEIIIPKKLFQIIRNFLAVIAGLYALIKFYNILLINAENMVPFLKIDMMLTILIVVAIIVLVIKEGKD